jgi:hypothetical protein
LPSNQPSYFQLDVPTYTPFAASAAAFFFHLFTVKGHVVKLRLHSLHVNAGRWFRETLAEC